MKRLTFTVLLSILLTQTLCTVTPRNGLPQASLLVEDRWATDLASIFDLTQATLPLNFSTVGGGKAFTQLQAFNSKHYDLLKVKDLNFVKVLTENILALVYDNTRVVFQEVDHDGSSLGPYLTVDLRTFGASLVCSDFAFNRQRLLAYIGCFDKSSSEIAPGSMAVFTYDFNTKDIADKVVVPQTDGLRIVTRLSMFLHTFPTEENKDITLLFVYDQGHTSQSENRQPRMVRTFFNINAGALEYDALLTTEIDGHSFDMVYDYFAWNGTMIVTTKMTGKGDNIFLAQCKLDMNEDLIKCGSKVRATPVSHGKVIIYEHGFYAEIDVPARELRYYRLHGAFTDINWNTDEVASQQNLNFPPGEEEHIWIRGISVSDYGGVIHYGQINHEDPGSTFIDWATGVNEYKVAELGVAYDREFVVGVQSYGQNQVDLIRIEPLYYLDAHTLDFGVNNIAVFAQDAVSNAAVDGRIVLLKSIFEVINIKNTIGAIDLLSHQTQDIVIHQEDVIWGNGVQVRIESENEEVVTGTGITQEPISFKFSGREGDHFDGEYIFSDDRVLIRNNYGTIIWTRCSLTHEVPKRYTCYEDGQYVVGPKETFVEKIFVAGEVITALSHNATASTIHLMNTQGEIRQFGFEEGVKDFGVVNTDTFTFVVLAFADRVDIYSFNKFDIEEFELYHSYNADNTEFELFCPVRVEIPAGSSDEFDILSNCGHTYARYAIRWGIDWKTPHYGVPISTQIHPTDFCAFENEFMIRGNEELYGITNQDDFGKFHVPVHDLGATVAYDFYCLRELGQVAIVGHSQEGTKNTITVINGNSATQQGRRYPTVVRDIEAEEIRVFEFMGAPLHMIINGEQRAYVRTYNAPILRMRAGSVDSETEVAVKITFYNGEAEQVFYQYVTVLPH